MSTSRADIEARLRAALPGFGAREGSQTLQELAGRQNLSKQAIEIFAQAQQRAEFQQREFAKSQARLFEEQQRQEAFNANVSRESRSLLDGALNSIGDDRTRQVLAENGTLSNQVSRQLTAQLENLRSSGDHVDRDGNLTFQAAALSAAVNQAGQLAQQDLQTRFGGDETARREATTRADRDLNSGALSNFVRSTIAGTTRNLGGFGAQVVAAASDQTTDRGRARADAAGRFAQGTNEFADSIDVVTPEERQFNQDFEASEGFLGGLSTILQNPGQALQSFGPGVAGALGSGRALTSGLGAVGRLATRAAGRQRTPEQVAELARQRAEDRAADLAEASPAGRAVIRAGERATDGIRTAAPAVFTAGGGDFAANAEEIAASDTDNLTDAARRGLAVSTLATGAAGLAGAAGLSTLDNPLRRFRGGDTSNGGIVRRTGSEAFRGGLGEALTEGFEGGLQEASEQIGDGATLADLDRDRVRSAAGRGAAAGLTLGGPTSGAVGLAPNRANRQQLEESIRSDLNRSTGQGSSRIPVPLQQPNLDRLSDTNVRNSATQFANASTEERSNFVLGIANDLGINSPNISFQGVDDIVAQSTENNAINPARFRENIGALLGTPLTTDATGAVIRSGEPTSTTPTPASTTPQADRVLDTTPESGIGDGDAQLDLLDSGNIDVTTSGVGDIDSTAPTAASASAPTEPPTIVGQTVADVSQFRVGDRIITPSGEGSVTEITDPDGPAGDPGDPIGLSVSLDTGGDTFIGVGPRADTATATPTPDATEGAPDAGTQTQTATEPDLSGENSTFETVGNTAAGGAVADADSGTTAAQLEAGTPSGLQESVDNADQQLNDPSVATADESGPLSDDIEAAFGDIPAIQRLRAGDGSPESQARLDFETNLLRQQVRAGLRQPGDLRGAGQLEIEQQLERAATEAGITDPVERNRFFEENRQAVADAFRDLRAQSIAENAPGFQPAAAPTDPLVSQPAAPDTSTTVQQSDNTLIRSNEELNIVPDETGADTAVIPEQLRIALISTYSPAQSRRIIPPDQRDSVRDQLLKPSDLSQPSDFAAANQVLRRIRDNISSVYRFRSEDILTGTGSFELKRTGTDATRAAAVADLRQTIPEDLNRLQRLMTPEGYQRVFGKKP